MLRQIFILVIISCHCFSEEILIELNHDLGPDSKGWPGQNAQPFTTSSLHLEQQDDESWYYAREFCSLEHIGTHLDAPAHFTKGGWTVDQIPIRHLIGPACVIDVLSKVDSNPLYQVSAGDVEDWVSQHGMFPNNSIVIAKTGWGRRYGGSVKNYFGTDGGNDTSFVLPGLAPKAVEVLLKYRESHGVYVVGIGIDGPSVDYGPSRTFESHRRMGAANVYGIENMINLQQLPATGAEVTVMPIKLRDGSGGPCRVIARIPDASSACHRIMPTTLVWVVASLFVGFHFY